MSKNEVVKKEAGALPAFLSQYEGKLGTDIIDDDDVTIPRLKLAQGMSQEVKDGNMHEGDIFNSLTGQVLAIKGEKLRAIPVAYHKEYILWRDRKDQGGGIMARAQRCLVNGDVRYKWDHPNQKFTTKIGGRIPVEWETKDFIDQDGLHQWGSEIPSDKDSGKAATDHHNYVFVLPDFDNMVVAASLSRTQTKRAKDLNGMLRLSTIPMFGRVFTIESYMETKDENSWANYRFRPAGVIQDESQFLFCKNLNEQFEEEGFVVDQSDAQADIVTESNKDKPF